MSRNPLQELTKFEQSIWLDFIRRDMLINGEMERLINEDKVKGVTSNPSIFRKAFDSGDIYDAAIRSKALQGLDVEEMYKSLAIEDIQFATDLFHPVYDETGGGDGYVSLEVSPHLAHDTQGSIREARKLWEKVDRPNVFIKIPGTKEGLPAIEQCLSEGINVNITLLFGLERYREVTEAYLSGLEKRLEAGKPIDHVASVASFFLSRIDVLVDPMIEKFMDGDDEKAELAKQMHGQVAIASARKAYQIYKEVFNSDRFKKLADADAKTQRVLWASTSTKNPDYSDVKYVEALIGPDTVNTIPMETLKAYRDHGKPQKRVEDDLDKTDQVLENLPRLDIDLKAITNQLIDEGVDKFNKPFDKLMDILEAQKEEALNLPVDEMTARLGPMESAVQDRLDQMDENDFNKELWNKNGALWKDDAQTKQMIPDAMGWLDVAQKMTPVVPRLLRFVRRVKEDGFTHVVHMGMGGSSLTPLLFERTFKRGNDGLPLTVLDTTDPATIQNIEQDIPLETTLFIVASKSGATAEPNAFGDYFYEKLKSRLGQKEAGDHFVVITDPESPLVEKAENRNYRHAFLNFTDIGGRYSALSYFGMVPAALMGLNIGDFIERALRMQYACKTVDAPADNSALKLGAALGECARRGRNKLTLVLPDDLTALGMWLEQLVAESTGKEGNGILPVTGEALLDPDDYGGDRLFVYIHLKGQHHPKITQKLEALSEAGQPVITIEMKNLQDIGQEFYRWEMAVAAAGAIIGINAFNQPNVQGSKEATHKLLEQVQDDGKLPKREADAEKDGLKFYGPGTASEADGLFRSFIDQLSEGDYLAIQAFITENKQVRQKLQHLRTAIQSRYKVAATIGYGPRFLHSTGQFHKGGPNTGLFIQLIADHEEKLNVPGKNYDFGSFQHAQAEGDLQALQDEGRRVLRIDLNSSIADGLDQLNEWVQKPTIEKA